MLMKKILKMTKIKLNILQQRTKFQYNGKEYIIGSKVWSTNGAKRYSVEYFGPQQDNKRLLVCHPKLGGQFQNNIDIWFNDETEVIVES